jgi:hypothetical protein
MEDNKMSYLTNSQGSQKTFTKYKSKYGANTDEAGSRTQEELAYPVRIFCDKVRAYVIFVECQWKINE